MFHTIVDLQAFTYKPINVLNIRCQKGVNYYFYTYLRMKITNHKTKQFNQMKIQLVTVMTFNLFKNND